MSNLAARHIYASVVERLFGVSSKTLHEWKLDGFLLPDNSQINIYSSETIDQFLVRQARGFETPPTTVDLLSGKVVLITTPEVRERLGLSSFAVNALLRHGHLAAIKLVGNWRVSEASVTAYDERRNSAEFLTRAQVQHVLSVTDTTVKELLANDRLKDRKVEGVNRVRAPITRPSLLRLLRELLPEWIHEEDWLEDRLESKRPLLAQYEAYRQLGITEREFQALVAARRLHIIARLSGPGVRVSAESVEAYLSYSGQLMTARDIAKLYGVSEKAVYDWYKEEQIPGCPIPNHVHGHPYWLYGSCWLAILDNNSSRGFQSVRWYQERMSGKPADSTLSLNEVSEKLNMSPYEIAQLASQGEISGIITPANQWRFSPRILRRRKPR